MPMDTAALPWACYERDEKEGGREMEGERAGERREENYISLLLPIPSILLPPGVTALTNLSLLANLHVSDNQMGNQLSVAFLWEFHEKTRDVLCSPSSQEGPSPGCPGGPGLPHHPLHRKEIVGQELCCSFLSAPLRADFRIWYALHKCF